MPGCPSSAPGRRGWLQVKHSQQAPNCILDAHCNAATSCHFVPCLLIRKKKTEGNTNAFVKRYLRVPSSNKAFTPTRQRAAPPEKSSELPHEQSALITSSSRVHGLLHKEASGYSLASHARQTQNHSHQTFIYALKEHKTTPNNFGECQETREPGETGCRRAACHPSLSGRMCSLNLSGDYAEKDAKVLCLHSTEPKQETAPRYCIEAANQFTSLSPPS